MLAKAVVPPVNLNPKCLGSNFSLLSSFPQAFHRRRNGHLRQATSGGGNRGFVPVRAGYTRTPTGTPGAYQLVDDETGEKYIVWGGADDDPLNSPIPSKDVLTWKPSRASNRRAREEGGSEHSVDSIPALASSKGPTRSFGRLKAQRVKALAKKYSPPKEVSNNYDYEPVAGNDYSDESDYSDSEFGTSGRKKEANVERQGDELKAADKLKAIRESLLRRGKEKVDYVVGRDRPDVRQGSGPEGFSVSHASDEGFVGWGKAGSSRDIQSKSADTKQRGKLSIHSDFHSRKSFTDIGCSGYLIESLRKQLFIRPSHIQAMAFRSVMEGKSCIVADQSGSGKTLAYLAPITQRLRQEELQGVSKSLPKSPRVVILVPTAELASQVLKSCRSISKFGVPFRSMVVTGGFKQKTQLENLEEGVDVLIATPGRFMYLVKEGFLELTNLTSVVLDEVDILCNDEDFEVALQSLISSSPVTAQYLFVTATLPIEIYNKLVEIFPDCEVIMGPGMHRTSPGLEEVLIDCSGEEGAERTPESAFENKKSALIQFTEESPVPKTIIFCNKIETCRKVENALKRLDRKGASARLLPFHAAMAQETRLANMKEFTTAQPNDISLYLICTDRASRGIDFAGVDHVILFDFPRDPSEYVRRVGRTARGAGGKGKAFVFAVGKQVSLARKIIERNQKGHPLHDVPSAYELMR